ncbi:hypothetical protein TTHERM_00112490 (macronuclear) [Tetrahymena thermophila SB210]|uniref:Helicase ATP-binding domain-containing protein n=1 Tax=Tetrahymena thermophila (strain SB210) TaxID=312017 RepID=Q22ZC2_TETTS|nr:hypothetical protein TTHERM_00112490 [Tetrahymena thermophila SB210]EAR90399.2 hypothetical protein TTHERM_00112490 [Tetrahymena thermophila SB210]|eukprot:XP_001010644.2 hypothetical protein TTHERM_00112490 [Tetrahymena thermophila SB210]
MITSIQQISNTQALVQVENQILIKDPYIKRYLQNQNRSKYEEKYNGYLIDIAESSFMKDKINFQISAKQKKKKLSDIPRFVTEAFTDFGNKLKIRDLKGNIVSEINYGNEQLANDLGLSQEHISDAIQMAFQMRGRVILADDPGLNSCKTAVNIAYAYDYKIPFLIIASSTQRQKWKSILKQQFSLKDKDIQILYNNQTQFDFKKDAIIATYDQVSTRKEELQDIKVALVDEAHYLRNIKFVNERNLMEYLCKRKRVVLLSSCCIIQSVEDLFPLLRVIRPDCFHNTKAFKDRYVNNENNWIELHCMLNQIGFIRRTRQMFADNHNFTNFGIVPIECDKSVTSIINSLVHNAHRIGGNFSKGIYSQCYTLSLDAKIKGCLQFIDRQLEQKPDDKIVIFGYHQKSFEMIGTHLQAKNITFIVVDKKTNFAQKEELLHQIDPQISVVLMSFTNLQDIELSLFSTAIVLEFSWTPHLIDQAIGCLYSLSQVNEQVDAFLLEGIGTLDKLLKGKYIKWLDLKTKILDGKKVDNLLNIQDVVSIDNQGSNRLRQNQSIDISFNEDNHLSNQPSKAYNQQKSPQQKKKRSRKNIQKFEISKLNTSKQRITTQTLSQDILPPEIKVDINQSKKIFMQKARTVEDLKKNNNNTKYKNEKFFQQQQHDMEIIISEDDIENITDERQITNMGQKNNNYNNKNNYYELNRQQNEQKDEQVFMTDYTQSFNEGFISIYEDIENNQSKNVYRDEEQFDFDYEENEFNQIKRKKNYSNRSMPSNYLKDIECDLNISEIQNNQVNSIDFGYDETPINKFQSQKSESHASLYKQIISKITDYTEPITLQVEDYTNDQKSQCQKPSKIIQEKKQMIQQTPNFIAQKQTDNDLDFLLKELEIEIDFEEKDKSNSQKLDCDSIPFQILDEDSNLEKNSQKDNLNHSNLSNQPIVYKGKQISAEKITQKKIPLKDQPFCRKLFDDEFSSPFGAFSKESALTKCSTNHFVNDNSCKKSSVFDKLILDIDESTKKSNVFNDQLNPKQNVDQGDLEYDDLFSINGQNAIGFFEINKKLNHNTNNNKNLSKEQFKTQQLFKDTQKTNDKNLFNQSDKNIEAPQQMKFTGLKKRKLNNSFKLDPKQLLKKKKIKTN